MGKKMTNAPVYFALGQIRFNPLMALDTFVPAIQEKLRRDYPDYTAEQTVNLVLVGEQPKPTIVTRYRFLNAARNAGFTLDQRFMSFQTTEYDTFDPFLAMLLEGLSVIHREATLSYSERLGMRFLDVVCPKSGENVSDYLNSSVLGLSERLDDMELVHSLSETRSIRGKATLVGRVIIHSQEEAGAAFPPDLLPIPLTLADRFSKVKGTYAILDTDSWIEDRHDFDLEYLAKGFELLRQNIRNSFDLMVTDHARKVWN